MLYPPAGGETGFTVAGTVPDSNRIPFSCDKQNVAHYQNGAKIGIYFFFVSY